MANETTSIETRLELIQLDETTFQNKHHLWPPMGGKAIYGGCVVAQSLLAAIMTVDPRLRPHSQHCYFLLPGVPSGTITYKVQKLRDGRSFCTRIVDVVQDDRHIFSTTISFQVKARNKNTLKHQETMPNVPTRPDDSDTPIMQMAYPRPDAIPGSPESLYDVGDWKFADPTSFRVLNKEIESISADKRRSNMWIKSSKTVINPIFHPITLAYLSDGFLISAAVLANNKIWGQDTSMTFSLDHIIYYHEHNDPELPKEERFRADDWLLYSVRTPWSGDNRALIIGECFTQRGQLVATVIQEGLIRMKEDEPYKKAKL